MLGEVNAPFSVATTQPQTGDSQGALARKLYRPEGHINVTAAYQAFAEEYIIVPPQAERNQLALTHF
jgi:hypothetical protein